MFRSKKTKEDPSVISFQEVEEDMLSFKHTTSFSTNYNHIVEEIKNNTMIDLKETETWWQLFKAFDAQMVVIDETAGKIERHKEELEEKSDAIRSERIDLQGKIETTLTNLRKFNSPS